jgi:hypothetical protein
MPPTFECAGQSCVVGVEVCCYSPGNMTAECALSCMGGLVEIECSSDADCTDGDTCCADLSTGSKSIQCESTCGEEPLCASDADCTPPEECLQAADAPTGYAICRMPP